MQDGGGQLGRFDVVRLIFISLRVEAVPESWFTWEGLDLPERSQVADTSIVDNVIVPVAVVGKSMEEEVPAGVHEIGGYGKVRWLLILVNIIAAGLLLGWFLRRRTSQ